MSDNEYDDDVEYFESDDSEEEEEESEEGESEGEIDVEIEPESEKIYNNMIIQKIDETDKNHRIIKVVPDNERRTSHILTRFELSNVIGKRASQISNGSPIFTDKKLSSSTKLAIAELIERQCPLILTRQVRIDGNIIEVEKWKVREMTIPMEDRNAFEYM